MQSSHNGLGYGVCIGSAQKYHNISKNAIKSQPESYVCEVRNAQKYHNISKNAIKSQRLRCISVAAICAKIPQYFKECNQVTTQCDHTPAGVGAKIPQYFKECNQVTTHLRHLRGQSRRKNTTIFQRMQSSHNSSHVLPGACQAQKYHNISKNAIKSQPLGFQKYYI